VARDPRRGRGLKLELLERRKGMSQAEFLKDCGPRGGPSAAETYWTKTIRAAFMIAFPPVWAAGVACSYFWVSRFRMGGPAATWEKTEPLAEHGKAVYIARSEKQRIDALLTGMKFGIPTAILLSLILHFGLGIKLSPHAPRHRRGREDRKNRRFEETRS
jgi:hypothetical protein